MIRSITKQPQIIAFKDFRLNAPHYIDAVARGESFIVVKRSRPAFRMEPIEDQWETVVDFTKINPNGVPGGDVLKAIDSLSTK